MCAKKREVESSGGESSVSSLSRLLVFESCEESNFSLSSRGVSSSPTADADLTFSPLSFRTKQKGIAERAFSPFPVRPLFFPNPLLLLELTSPTGPPRFPLGGPWCFGRDKGDDRVGPAPKGFRVRRQNACFFTAASSPLFPARPLLFSASRPASTLAATTMHPQGRVGTDKDDLERGCESAERFSFSGKTAKAKCSHVVVVVQRKKKKTPALFPNRMAPFLSSSLLSCLPRAIPFECVPPPWPPRGSNAREEDSLHAFFDCALDLFSRSK